MKRIIILILGFIPIVTLGQDIKEKLQGNWVCNKIIDSLNIETEGKFGKSGAYLQFKFDKSYLTILDTPFDLGLKIDFYLNKNDSIIDLFPKAMYELPERKYRIKHLSTKHLILKTNNYKNQSIFYVFTNQDEYLMRLQDSTLIDCGNIVIKHLKLDEKSKGANRVAEYLIDLNPSLFNPTPYFNDYASSNLGHFISINFEFPKNFPIDTLTDELIIEFLVTNNGAEEIQIIKGLDEDINQSILKIFEKSAKKWKPITIENKTKIVKLRFHLFFYYGLMDMPINFK